MNRHIESNKQGIKENKEKIMENRSEIQKIKDEARWTSEAHQTRLERIIHRLITVLVISWVIIAILLAVLGMTYKQGGLNIFNKDGVSNVIGGDGTIGG